LIDWPDASLSLGSLITAGAPELSKGARAWWGPHEAAYLASRLPPRARSLPDAPARTLAVVLCAGGALVLAHVRAAGSGGSAAADPGQPWSHPVLALLPLRLGLGHRLEPGYHALLRDALEQPACVGAVAGPRRSAMFIFTAEALEDFARDAHDLCVRYLDPHVVRESPPAAPTDPQPPQWFVESLRAPALLPQLRMDALDPTLCLGFLLRSSDELADFAQRTDASVAARHASASDGSGAGLPLRLFSILERPVGLLPPCSSSNSCESARGDSSGRAGSHSTVPEAAPPSAASPAPLPPLAASCSVAPSLPPPARVQPPLPPSPPGALRGRRACSSAGPPLARRPGVRIGGASSAGPSPASRSLSPQRLDAAPGWLPAPHLQQRAGALRSALHLSALDALAWTSRAVEALGPLISSTARRGASLLMGAATSPPSTAAAGARADDPWDVCAC